MKEFKLMHFDSNRADEMDIKGWLACTPEFEDIFFKNAKKYFKENGSFTMCIGTNEEIEFENFKDFKSSFDIATITESEFVVLRKLFGGGDDMDDNPVEYGFFPSIDIDEFED